MSVLIAGARRRGATLADPPGIPASAPYNVATPATTPTYDGTGSAVHPGVVDFGRRWNGWRFWMAMTPFYLGDSKVENPSVIVSQDGITWQVPPGLTNPIYPRPSTGWLSDADLEYDPDSDELVMVYRDEFFQPRVARSSDGVTWPAVATEMDWPQLVAYSQDTEAVSPSLVRLAQGQWAMWMIAARNGRFVYRWTATSPEGPWSAQESCTGFVSNVHWHLDVVLHQGVYRALIHNREANTLITASSTDGLAWARGGTVIVASGAGWDSTELYRAAIQPHEDGQRMRVWYSGKGATWRIGHTIIPLSEWPEPPV